MGESSSAEINYKAEIEKLLTWGLSISSALTYLLIVS